MTKQQAEDSGGCCHGFKEEFKPRMFLLEHEVPGLFHKAKVARGGSVLYLVWRVFWVIYHIVLIALSAHLNQFYASTQENRRKWPIFMTNWALSALTISTIIDMVLSFFFYFNKQHLLRGESGSMSWYVKVFWVEMNIANAMGLVVGVTYWAALYDYSLGLAGYRILPFLTHGVNIMYIVVNLFVVAMPVRLLHFFHASIFFSVYMVFNAVYVVAGGTNDQSEPYIYPILDWNKAPGTSTGIAVFGIFGSAFAHLLIYLVYVVREKIFGSCCSKNGVV